MHIAYRAENLLDAHLVKDALEHAGIRAFVAGEYLTGAVGQLPAMDYVAVMVSPSQADEAGHVVARVEAMMREGRAALAEQPDPGGSVLPA
ncbi:putative signal transducing protein [Frateuria aurantia]